MLLLISMVVTKVQSFILPNYLKPLLYSRSRSVIMQSSLEKLLKPTSTNDNQFVFVGGKGGVGKTTSSAAIALSLSAKGHNTLVVSSDPAHSLADALNVHLNFGKLTELREPCLWALEIDMCEALAEFKKFASGFSSESISTALGIPKHIVDSFRLEEIADLFANPPPGIDEIVALTKIFQFISGAKEQRKFDRIVVDTAPTGHTLRLLQLPAFLNSLTGKLIKLQLQITTAVDSFKMLFGGEASPASEEKLKFLNKLNELQGSLSLVQNTLRDSKRTQFVVVSVPTQLAVLESSRLVNSLQKEGISISTILCNQMLSQEAGLKFIKQRILGQRAAINDMNAFLASTECKLITCESSVNNDSAISNQSIEVIEMPYLDTEVRGLHELRRFHARSLLLSSSSPFIPDAKRLTIFGGKGGVGK